MMDRGARTFYSPLKRVSMKQGGKVICTLLSTARANRVQSCSDLVCVRKITSSTNYSLGSMSGDAICKNRYTVRSVHLSEQGCTVFLLSSFLSSSISLLSCFNACKIKMVSFECTIDALVCCNCFRKVTVRLGLVCATVQCLILYFGV